MSKEIILTGIQGAGKGEQGKRLINDLRFHQIGTGDALRAMAASGSDLGRQLNGFMAAGQLVPDDIVNTAVEEAVLAKGPDQRLLFDGFPRTLAQARALDTILERANRKAMCIHLLLDAETARQRMRQRGRPDDMDPNAVETRITSFFTQTAPVLDHYRSQGRVVEVDASHPIDDTYDRIRSIIHTILC